MINCQLIAVAVTIVTQTKHPNKTSVNYQLLVVNSMTVASVFIFFAIAAQVPAPTIFAIDINKCSFGFDLTVQDAQIAVVMVAGILILLLSISYVLLLVVAPK